MSKKTTESRQAYAATLAKANRFDSSALPRNRDGHYTTGQRVKLCLVLISMFFSSLLGIGFGILFFNTGLNRFPKEEPLAEWIMLLFSIFLFLVGIWWIYEGGKQLLRSWWPLLIDIVGGKLAVEKGQERLR